MEIAKPQSFNVFKNTDMQFGLAIIFILLLMFIPIPPFLIDFFLTLSITMGLLTLLVAIYIKEPLQFSTFPTFLLISTLARLSLNVATTRNILLNGSTGHVSQLVKTFGSFVVGGNYIVGCVIFLILIIINFMVITKGASRIAEVGARFTLDAMPGKQMSIDADLNAGIIDRDEAKKRRYKIEKEADFYGSMDGASKFVRGDAIASLIITAINIVVGLLLGVLQHKMSFSQAAQTYTLLTIGDGLVSQIPAVVISVASGIVVSRTGGEIGLSGELKEQIFLNPKALFICASLILLLAAFPGIPSFPLLSLSAFFFFLGKKSLKILEDKQNLEKKQSVSQDQTQKDKKKQASLESVLHVDILSLEVGVGLIPLVDSDQNGEILERIVSARRQFAQDMGVIVPMIMVRDNVQLKPGEYQILLKGNPVAKGLLMPDCELAMSPEEIFEPVIGVETKEPAYGLDALWIRAGQREEASFKGYTVVNCATVVVTHITKVIQEHAHELLGRQEVQALIDGLKEKFPKVVEEVLPANQQDGLTLGVVVKVLQNLLEESVNVRDLLTIFECLADYSKSTKNPIVLTRHVRKAIGRSLVRKYLSPKETIMVVNLDRSTEDLILSGLKYHDDGSSTLNLDPSMAQKLLAKIAESMSVFNKTGTVPILLCGAQLRWDLRKLVSRFIPGITVISFDEVPSDIPTEALNTIKI
ncbi:MAG: flagellar biosynthesis protein FlhA [Oligoflexales bacterium]|nr:flagellar biosynthesis protein FlhA [Oligoflexales bacterium]